MTSKQKSLGSYERGVQFDLHYPQIIGKDSRSVAAVNNMIRNVVLAEKKEYAQTLGKPEFEEFGPRFLRCRYEIEVLTDDAVGITFTFEMNGDFEPIRKVRTLKYAL